MVGGSTINDPRRGRGRCKSSVVGLRARVRWTGRSWYIGLKINIRVQFRPIFAGRECVANMSTKLTYIITLKIVVWTLELGWIRRAIIGGVRTRLRRGVVGTRVGFEGTGLMVSVMSKEGRGRCRWWGWRGNGELVFTIREFTVKVGRGEGR